ncbi:MAG: acyltransferase family protein, partial [Bacteroidales bacterium]|nr:acyltransferase family protein [Bacteroidales bacterium]
MHSGFSLAENYTLNNFIQNFISLNLGTMAVPFFFMTSGFLFFLKVNSFEIIQQKIKKRIKTLLIPYIIACTYFVLIFVLFQSIPQISNYINGDIISQLLNDNVFHSIKQVFWAVDNRISPFAYQLWFLRNLIIIIILTPIIHFFSKKINLLFPAILILVGFYLKLNNHSILASIFTSMFWFSIGSIISIHNVDLIKENALSKSLTFLFVIIFISYSVINSLYNFEYDLRY